MTARYDYRSWDGSQEFGDFDPDELLAQLTDDLLGSGDLEDSLRRLMNSGMQSSGGDHTMGLREMLERLRRRRAELLEQGSPSGQFAEIAEQLEEIIETERDGIDDLVADAEESGDERRREVTNEVAGERRMALDLLPDDLVGRVNSLRHYEFISSEAREQFEALVEQLRQDVTRTYFEGVSNALENMDPEQVRRMREAFDALNTMLEQRERGDDLDPTFQEFMENYGDLFDGNPETLDQLLEQLAQRMAAAEAMWQSLSPDQRDQLRGLAESMLDDMDLRWQMDRLNQNLRRAFPDAGWQQGYRFTGEGSMGMNDATNLTAQLNELDRLEDVMQSASSSAALSEIDLDEVKRHLGPDAARSLDRLARLTKELKEAGLIENRGGRVELTPKGVRRIGQKALSDLFSQVARQRSGDHRTSYIGMGHDREETTKPYEYGDPLNLHLSATVHNAVRRAGSGIPVRLEPDDFEIIETEALTRSATALLVDLSMSMPMRDNFVPAKKMALALHALISNRFPRDFLGIIGFSEVAREISPEDLPSAMWDYVYGTNLQHALALARRMLAHQHGTKQIIIVTDGEPTAHIDASGEPYFDYPPSPETLRLTLTEVVRCTRSRITINTFALDPERRVWPFVQQMTKLNGGRAFLTTPDALGGYVLVDFLAQRQVLRPAG